jgi:L-fuculose-phosphate aldolase
MGNQYLGTKFKTTFRSNEVSVSPLFKIIKHWSAIFAKHNFAPAMPGGFGGNLSIRDGSSFFITASGADLANLSENEIVKVCQCDFECNAVEVIGCKEPSSETLLHNEIYKNRPEVNAIFHGHYPPFEEHAKRLNLKVTENEAPYGSIALVKEVIKILANENIVIIKNHGFLSMAKEPNQAGNQILNLL